MAIKCCYGCVPPKRYPGCHGQCPEYLAEKAEYDRLMAQDREKREIGNAIYSNRSVKVNNAMRRRRNKKYG
jgi:hypothetical protein